jgi:hypothetical protein
MTNKVLFVHDGPTGVYNEQAFGISYKSTLVQRYAFFGNSVSFLMRSQSLNPGDLHKYSKIDRPNFNSISIPNFKSLKSLHNKNKARNLIHKAVETHDVIIVRLPSAAGVIAFKEAKKLNKPVLVEFVACVFDALWNYDWRGKILAKYKFKQYQNLMQDATHTVYVTNAFFNRDILPLGNPLGVLTWSFK